MEKKIMARRSYSSRRSPGRRTTAGRTSTTRKSSSRGKSTSSRSKSKVYLDKKGYKRYANSGKSVHRHVAGKKLGRKLKAGEVVHHKNRNKLDNSRKNLQVLPSQKAHEAVHKKSLRLSGKW